MIGVNQISWMAIPGVRIEHTDIIWAPSTIILQIENEFHIQGMLFHKSKSPTYSFPRFLFSYILIRKMKLCPEVINNLYGIKHDLAWHGCNVVENMLDTKTPRHYYLKSVKLIQRIKRWDIQEILVQLESKPAPNASHLVIRKNILEQSMAVAQSTRQSDAVDATVPEELKLQQQ